MRTVALYKSRYVAVGDIRTPWGTGTDGDRAVILQLLDDDGEPTGESTCATVCQLVCHHFPNYLFEAQALQLQLTVGGPWVPCGEYMHLLGTHHHSRCQHMCKVLIFFVDFSLVFLFLVFVF